jgi:hypothetical protein
VKGTALSLCTASATLAVLAWFMVGGGHLLAGLVVALLSYLVLVLASILTRDLP